MSSITFKNLDHTTDTCAICFGEVTNAAVHKVGIDIVSQMFINRDIHFIYCQDVILAAAENGHTDIVRMLLTGYTIPPLFFQKILTIAAENGHSDVVRLLISINYPISIACLRALSQGLDFSNAARGCAIERAARKGHLEIVRELFTSRGIPIEHAILAAAKNGHFNIVSLLLTGYEVSNHAATAAVGAGAIALAALGNYFNTNKG